MLPKTVGLRDGSFITRGVLEKVKAAIALLKNTEVGKKFLETIAYADSSDVFRSPDVEPYLDLVGFTEMLEYNQIRLAVKNSAVFAPFTSRIEKWQEAADYVEVGEPFPVIVYRQDIHTMAELCLSMDAGLLERIRDDEITQGDVAGLGERGISYPDDIKLLRLILMNYGIDSLKFPLAKNTN